MARRRLTGSAQLSLFRWRPGAYNDRQIRVFLDRRVWTRSGFNHRPRGDSRIFAVLNLDPEPGLLSDLLRIHLLTAYEIGYASVASSKEGIDRDYGADDKREYQDQDHSETPSNGPDDALSPTAGAAFGTHEESV